MSSSLERQIARIEEMARRRLEGPCATCGDAGRLHVLVPDPVDVDLPITNPTHCPECGAELEAVRQLVGVSKADSDRMLTGADGVVHSLYCPTSGEA